MSENERKSRERKVKLWCPLVSKMVAVVAGEEQRLDLGYLAKVFGLDPSSLKLNGHFISRGVDLVSSSVTWRSLLNYFSAKGLSTGEDDGHALVVDGKLHRAGTATTKRARSPENSAEGIFSRNEPKGGSLTVSSYAQNEDGNLLTNKKLKESKSGLDGNPRVSKWKDLIFKRKELMEEVRLLKKLKINEANSDFGGKVNIHPAISTSPHLKCSYIDGNLKRLREDEVSLATPCKRIR